MTVDDRVKKNVMDAKVVRGTIHCSDQYSAMARIRVQEK